MNRTEQPVVVLRPFPKRIVHDGHSVSLEPLTHLHVPELWNAAVNADDSWTHLRYGPFQTIKDLEEHISDFAGRDDQPFWAVRPRATGRASGWLSLCDIAQADASIEIGSIWYSPGLQRTRAATEAVFLLMRHAFDELGYQRLVWRCIAQNDASHRAAKRYGFLPEGIWRSAVDFKGQRSDIAWFAMLRHEWPSHKETLRAWLSDQNFDENGIAQATLAQIRHRFNVP